MSDSERRRKHDTKSKKKSVEKNEEAVRDR